LALIMPRHSCGDDRRWVYRLSNPRVRAIIGKDLF
jgi:hypothetical protein